MEPLNLPGGGGLYRRSTKAFFNLGISGCFIKQDGSISKDIVPDLPHLSPAGYVVRAAAIAGKFRRLVR